MGHKNSRNREERYYVHPHSGGWAVDCENNSPVSYSYEEKNKAINTAKTLAKEHHTEVLIQKQDGSVENKLSFH